MRLPSPIARLSSAKGGLEIANSGSEQVPEVMERIDVRSTQLDQFSCAIPGRRLRGFGTARCAMLRLCITSLPVPYVTWFVRSHQDMLYASQRTAQIHNLVTP